MPGSQDAVAAEELSKLDDDTVREYLKNHNDFLQRNPDMLDFLHVSHASGSAVSLVEKQVAVLRERNTEMRHRLNALTANARENDKLYERTRRLVLRLLEASNERELCQYFLDSMRDEFAVEHASVILHGDPAGSKNALRYETPERIKLEIGGLLKGRKPLCGVLRKEELKFLFPGARELGSAAVMPLEGPADKLGVIAVGSSDADRYYTGMGTLFLTHIADVLVRLLLRKPADGSG